MMDFSENASSSKKRPDVGIVPKVEDLSFDFPDENANSRIMGENVASSSGSNMRSSFIGMGFPPSLVDRAIKENGDGNVNLILEALFTYSALQSPNSDQSDSVDGLFEDNSELHADCGAREARHSSNHSMRRLDAVVKEEDDESSILNEKRASLLGMHFTKDEVEFGISKLGVDAPIADLVDLIFAARVAAKYEKGPSDPAHNDAKNVQECSTEALFGALERTLKLLEMGFSEEQISMAIDKYGSEAPLSQLAASIVAGEECDTKPDQCFPASFSASKSTAEHYSSIDPLLVKTEAYSLDDVSLGNSDILEKLKSKMPKEKYVEEPHCPKRLKVEYEELPEWLEVRRNSLSFGSLKKQGPRKKVHRAEQQASYGVDKMAMPKSCKTHDKMVAEPPYFFYGSITNLTHDSWCKISQFLYSIQPEFVNTQSFSALSRQEGYVHNLPTENRFHIVPKPPMTIKEALPWAKKWWPSWDTRKHLSCLSSETTGISEACERLVRILDNHTGLVSVTQQADFVRECQIRDLVWVGCNKLAPIEPDDLERILGYPVRHTSSLGLSLKERHIFLNNCFEVVTLAFHLSALKSLFPKGLRLLSIYTGIGGAEVALHKLGVQLNVVVSVEPCGTKRRILKDWWDKEAINGELVQLENIGTRLGTTKLEALINKYSGFDIVIGQNPSSSDSMTGTDFQLFYEFVRAVQRVRRSVGKSRC